MSKKISNGGAHARRAGAVSATAYPVYLFKSIMKKSDNPWGELNTQEGMFHK
jgi:hypothetical protein